MINYATLIGRAGGDPEIRTGQGGSKIATFSLATSESWRDKATGERRERTEWHRIVVFQEGIAGVVEQFVRKGSKLYVVGAIKTRKWTDDRGVERSTTEIVLSGFSHTLQLLDKAGGGRPAPADSPEDYGSESTRQSKPSGSLGAQPGYDPDDEIPF